MLLYSIPKYINCGSMTIPKRHNREIIRCFSLVKSIINANDVWSIYSFVVIYMIIEWRKDSSLASWVGIIIFLMQVPVIIRIINSPIAWRFVFGETYYDSSNGFQVNCYHATGIINDLIAKRGIMNTTNDTSFTTIQFLYSRRNIITGRYKYLLFPKVLRA